MSFAKIILVGNLGRDPELRYTTGNIPVCTFSVAVNEKEDGKEHTVWYRVTFWREKAEQANKYLTKGRQVYVEGKLRVRNYESNGENRTSLEVTGTELQFVDRKPQPGEALPHQPASEVDDLVAEALDSLDPEAEAAPPPARPRTDRVRHMRPREQPQPPPPPMEDHRTNPDMGF